MSYVVRRSGRKLGTLRDARIAHAIHTGAVASVQNDMRQWRAEYELWRRAYDLYEAEWNDRPIAPAHRDYIPGGWSRVGQGSYRTAYLSPKGVVYKVNNEGYDHPDREGNNYAEVQNIITIRHLGLLPREWAVPDVTLYKVTDVDYVVAMPLLDTSAPLNSCWGNRCDCANEEGNKRMGGMCTNDLIMSVMCGTDGLSDIHVENVYPSDDGVLWLLDVAI